MPLIRDALGFFRGLQFGEFSELMDVAAVVGDKVCHRLGRELEDSAALFRRSGDHLALSSFGRRLQKTQLSRYDNYLSEGVTEENYMHAECLDRLSPQLRELPALVMAGEVLNDLYAIFDSSAPDFARREALSKLIARHIADLLVREEEPAKA